MKWDKIFVFFAEITLKGENREFFVNVLKNNIQTVLGQDYEVSALWDRLEITGLSKESYDEALGKVAQVFGVAHTEAVKMLERDKEVWKQQAIQFYNEAAGKNSSSFAIRVKRIDKDYPMTSQELEREIGATVLEQTEAEEVDLENPDILVGFRLEKEQTYLLSRKVQGPHGLPTGSSGRALSLFSGGVDSAVASWYAMRRGLVIDFIHFHVFRDGSEVEGTKIIEMASKLLKPQGQRGRLFALPYYLFQLALTESNAPKGLELILFRRFMVRAAQVLALKKRHKALILGDNLGQVASQTVENLTALDEVAEMPLLRPLLIFNKEETIGRGRAIDIYELAIADYKDCCSILSRHPLTRPKLSDVIEAEQALPLERLLADTLDELCVLEI